MSTVQAANMAAYERSMTIRKVLGFTLLAIMLPIIGPVIGTAMLWDAVDRGFRGNPRTGILMRAVDAFDKWSSKYNHKFVRHKEDAFMVNAAILYGIVVPLVFYGCMWHTLTHGFSLKLAFLYNVLRIGPYFMNFAYVYTLCHKEGHSRVGLWADPVNPAMRYLFNWWAGLFYGVVPATFAYGHTRNHHKYNNSSLDIVSTADTPRDSFVNWVSYLPRFTLYATNISGIYQFWAEGDMKSVVAMLVGSLVHATFVLMAMRTHTMFGLAYAIYPLLENVILLAAINWTWHGFIDPTEPDNEYVNSTTIFDGQINVLEEDFHVLHHSHCGVHWTESKRLLEARMDKYEEKVATIFRDTHPIELFFIMIFRDYKMLAEKFVDLSDKLTMEEKEQLMKDRLRACAWGPLAVPTSREARKFD